MVDGVNQQPGLFQRIGNFFGAGDPSAGQRVGTPFFPADPNAENPTDPFAGLSRAQRTMLGFAALRDAAASLEGRDSDFFQSAMGGFEQARERERLRTQGALQNLANIEQQIAVAQFTGIPVSPALLQMRDVLSQQLAPTMPTPVAGAAPVAGTMPSAPATVAPSIRPSTGGAIMDATGAVVGGVDDEPLSPAAQAAMAGETAPTAAPADGIDAKIAEQQQRQLELLEAIDTQGRGAQGHRLPANTGALEAELRIVNDEINRLRDEKAAAATAATAAEENRLVSEDAARQARYNRNVIGGILNDPALNSIVGRIEGQTQPGTIAGAALFGEDQLNLLAKIDQLEGQVFLEARDMLRGGGQITDFEGRRAQTALSRIGQRGVSEEAYRQALTELDQVFANSEARALGQPVPFPEIDTDPDAEAAPQAGLTPEQQALVDRYR